MNGLGKRLPPEAVSRDPTSERTNSPVVTPAHFLPVHRVPPRLEVIRAAVLVLEIVGMLPHVVAEDRGRLAVHERIVLIRRARDRELTTLVDEPHPPRAEPCGAGRVELLLELLEVA